MKKRSLNADHTIGSALFDAGIRLFFFLYVFSIFWIFWQLVVTAVSPEIENNSVQIRVWTKNFTTRAFYEIWITSGLNRAFFNNIYITIFGTATHVFICTMAGYALSRPAFPLKQLFMQIILISMLIPAQMTMVPTFMLYRSFKLINNLNALVVSGMVAGFSIILMRNYFIGIPSSLSESARLDGAGEMSIFVRIFIPISFPGLATIITLQLVAKWNTFFDAVLFINSTELQPLQTRLNMIISSMMNAAQIGNTETANLYGQNVRSAAILISIAPLLVIYPFMQKYLVKGMLTGSVKG